MEWKLLFSGRLQIWFILYIVKEWNDSFWRIFDLWFNWLYRIRPVLCRLPIYSQSQSISINFNPFQSLSIPNLNGDWDWIVNPIFWGRLGLSQSQSFTFANRWFCPIYVSEIHKKVLCQNSQMLDLSYHISSEYTFSFSCLPQWARKYRKSSYSAGFLSKEGSRLDCRSHF